MTAASPARRSVLRAFVAALSAAAIGSGASASDGVSLEEARAALESGRVRVIDIREREEHARGVARGAHLLPMSEIGSRLAEISGNPSQPVLLICNTQNRSRATLKALRDKGYGHVRYVDGGMSEWARRGWPMVAPPR